MGRPLHGIVGSAISEFLSLLHPCSWDPLQFITEDTTHLITGQAIIPPLLDIGSRGTGKADGLPMDGSELGFQVIGNTVPDDQ